MRDFCEYKDTYSAIARTSNSSSELVHRLSRIARGERGVEERREAETGDLNGACRANSFVYRRILSTRLRPTAFRRRCCLQPTVRGVTRASDHFSANLATRAFEYANTHIADHTPRGRTVQPVKRPLGMHKCLGLNANATRKTPRIDERCGRLNNVKGREYQDRDLRRPPPARDARQPSRDPSRSCRERRSS